MYLGDATPLRIQQACDIFVVTRLMGLISSEERIAIDQEAYEDGGNVTGVLVVYTILMRDSILKRRGMSVPPYADDVDESVSYYKHIYV